MFRHLAYGVFLVGFGAFAWRGYRDWTDATIAQGSRVATLDEEHLRTGFLLGETLVHHVNMGYPWPDVLQKVPLVKRELPPDLRTPTLEDLRKDIERKMLRMQFTFPSGRLSWPEIKSALRDRIEPEGIALLDPPEQPPDAFTIEIPQAENWTGNSLLYHLNMASQRTVSSVITSQGVCVGRDSACNSAKADEYLEDARRRVEPEHADPRLSARFLPDLSDAHIDGFANVVAAQTGIPMVVDVRIWEKGVVVKWRGEPRTLRGALDELCRTLHSGTAPLPVYWRFHDGRVWLLMAGP
jgi:hypothetical protein